VKKILNKIGIVLGLLVLIFGASAVPATVSSLQEQKIDKYDGYRGFLLIPDSTAKSVGMYSPYDGSYLGDLIVDTTRFTTPINAVVGPDGNIYVSDQVADSVFVYDASGTYLYTYADSTDGLDNIRGIDFRENELFISMGGTPKCVARFSGPHTRLADFIADGTDPFDILFLNDGRALVADILGSTDNIRLYDTNGILLQILFVVSFPEQIQFDSLAPGGFLTAAFSANVIHDFELDGTIVQTTSYSSGRGVFRLGNGNLLATSSDGIQEIEPGTGTIIQTEKTGSGRFIEAFISGENQPPNTPSDPTPIDGAVDVSLDITLSWTGGDPDPGDFVTYDVFFGTTSPPPLITQNISTPSFSPGYLEYNQLYYWKIVAWDSYGLTADGPLWSFSTIVDNTPPNTTLQTSGTLGNDDWYISNVTLTFQAVDNVSGVNTIFYKIDEGEWLSYEEAIEISIDGLHLVEYYSIDNAGNTETLKSSTFKIDKTSPSWVNYTFTPQNLLKNKWLCVATVEDETSGIALIEFYVDGALIGSVTEEPYEFLYEGVPEDNSQAIAYDAAGNAAMSPIASSIEVNNQQQYLTVLQQINQKSI
jgi:hypothetical protein